MGATTTFYHICILKPASAPTARLCSLSLLVADACILTSTHVCLLWKTCLILFCTCACAGAAAGGHVGAAGDRGGRGHPRVVAARARLQLPAPGLQRPQSLRGHLRLLLAGCPHTTIIPGGGMHASQPGVLCMHTLEVKRCFIRQLLTSKCMILEQRDPDDDGCYIWVQAWRRRWARWRRRSGRSATAPPSPSPPSSCAPWASRTCPRCPPSHNDFFLCEAVLPLCRLTVALV